MASSPKPDYRASVDAAKPRRARSRFLYERRAILLSIICTLPGMVAFGVATLALPWSNQTRISAIALLAVVSFVAVALLHDQIIRPLQTLTNVIAALREEDYSFRARGAGQDDALGELSLEINLLADVLTEQRTRTIEATALLRRVVEVIGTPLFTFDPEGLLRLVNSAGDRLLQKPAAALLGRSAQQIGISACIQADDQAQITLPQSPNTRWLVRRTQFRQNGVPHTLVVLSDVSRALREEERNAWQRLIRVLGHELNNSLAPIKSIAGTLSVRVQSLHLDEAERQDFTRGLQIIELRADSLNRFLQAYGRMAQMPPPSLRSTDIRTLLDRVAVLETRVPVEVDSVPAITATVDPDQIEQLLINLVKNAAEAMLEHTSSAGEHAIVRLSATAQNSRLIVQVIDCGPGLLNPDNAFVPFYTTKPEGTGVGLVLCRQIAEAHHGSLRLSNRKDRTGCVATLSIPLHDPAPSAS